MAAPMMQQPTLRALISQTLGAGVAKREITARLSGAVDAEKALELCRRLESTHLAFLLSGVLVRDFGPVVFILAGSMGDRWENLSMRRRIASELVGNELPWVASGSQFG